MGFGIHGRGNWSSNAGLGFSGISIRDIWARSESSFEHTRDFGEVGNLERGRGAVGSTIEFLVGLEVNTREIYSRQFDQGEDGSFGGFGGQIGNGGRVVEVYSEEKDCSLRWIYVKATVLNYNRCIDESEIWERVEWIIILISLLG